MEKHKITGTSHYIENIELIAIPNPFYEDSKKEIIDNYMTDERIYEYTFEPRKIELRPEDDNPYDKKAVALYLNDLLVGYIKKGSCSHVRKLIKEDKIQKVEVDIYGGRYKIVNELIEDEDDISVDYNNPKYELEKGETPYKIDLFIYTEEDDKPQNNETQDTKEDNENKKDGVNTEKTIVSNANKISVPLSTKIFFGVLIFWILIIIYMFAN